MRRKVVLLFAGIVRRQWTTFHATLEQHAVCMEA
jgi:hypothetical protein